MIQNLTEHDREHLQEALGKSGQKVTPQREAVFTVLLAQRDHPTVDEVFQRAREVMPGLSLALALALALISTPFFLRIRLILTD